MTVPDKLPNGSRPREAPALARLLADSSLSRAALAACGFPVALAFADRSEIARMQEELRVLRAIAAAP